jgi:hypothetical protein
MASTSSSWVSAAGSRRDRSGMTGLVVAGDTAALAAWAAQVRVT